MTAERRRTAWSELSRGLELLERAATGAVVPGDLRAWCTGLERRIGQVRELTRRYDQEEAALCEQIVVDDPGLTPRVDGLTRAFEVLAVHLRELQEQTAELLSQDRDRPTESEEPTERVRELRKRSLAWIVAMRAHHGEAETWLVEAVYRDRGVQD